MHCQGFHRRAVLVWACLCLAFAGAGGLTTRAATESTDGIWHLRLRFTADGVEGLGAVRTAGVLKEGRELRGEIEVELLRGDGSKAAGVAVEDPRVRRFEYETAPGSGELTSLRVEAAEAECEVRLPADPAGERVAVYRKIPAGNLPVLKSAIGGREKLGEFGMPPREGAGSRLTTVITITPVSFTMLTNGPSSRRLNIIFVSEGYRTNQVTAFTNQARLVLEQFLGNPPFNAYRKHINARAAFVPSKESGSDHPSRGLARDTYFQTTYDTSGIAYLITFTGDGHARAQAAARAVEPEFDIVVCIVNDQDYGGSGGTVLLTSAHPDSARIAIHELGHTFGGLTDEYETPYPGYPVFDVPNATQETARDRIKWRSWILASTPVPTPAVTGNASLVGLFEGARYQSTGWYRPKLNCLMRTLGQPYCEVCREAMTLRLYQALRPVDSVAPGTNAVVRAASSGPTRLEVKALEPTLGAMVYEWRINGGPVLPVRTPVVDLLPADLSAGTNAVTVRVSDPTAWVRNDPKGLMAQEVRWRVARPVGAPTVQAMLEADGWVAVSWAAAAGDFVVETTASLANPAWRTVPTASVVEGTSRVVRVEAVEPLAFYRLRGP